MNENETLYDFDYFNVYQREKLVQNLVKLPEIYTAGTSYLR